MPEPDLPPARPPASSRRPVIGLSIAGGAVVVGLGLVALASQFGTTADPAAADTPTSRSTLPRMALADGTPVIGVVIDGRHRAYPLVEFMRPQDHVRNDLMGDVPVTVAFCDLSNCVRAYTDTRRGERLTFRVGGANPNRARSMLLVVGEKSYDMESGVGLEGEQIPYTSVPAVRTTWGEWKREHPDTDAVVGGTAERPPAGGW